MKKVNSPSNTLSLNGDKESNEMRRNGEKNCGRSFTANI
jgi:hypothetical protein